MEQQNDLRQKGEKLFVGGDLSGIQKFIYNISSKKAAVSLKGRSYYLSEYTEQLCGGIMDLPEAKNVDKVYCSGGKFYLIVDNTPEMRNAIDQFRKTATQKLWEEHKGQLGLNISYVAFSFNQDGTVIVGGAENGKIGLLWKFLTEDFNKLKTKKFCDVILDKYESFFEMTPIAEKTKICAITGIEDPGCVELGRENDERDIFVLPSVKKQIELGKSLRNTEHFKTFEEYAENSYLGVLRMDVDGLGKRFIEGFNSLEEYRTFSKKLQMFFSVTIRNIKKSDDFKNDLNIIYAGGDDIFVVGKWNKAVEFAYKVRNRFAEYIEDKNITISGGIAIVDAKFPIAKAAELSGEAEDTAKKFERSEKGIKVKKNAFCLFGEAVSWNEEFDYIVKYKQLFYDMIETFGMSKGILHKIMLYASIAKDNVKKKYEGKSEDYSYIWHSTYYLTRMLDRYKSNEVVKSFIKDIRDGQFTCGTRKILLLSLAARWAELEIKETKQK